MSAPDPRVILRSGHMSGFQIGIVAICVLIAGLDGFDVLVVAFTATALVGEWGLSPSALGQLLSAGLAGMWLGALVMGPVGDRHGRRRAVLVCLAILIVGMPLSAMATSATEFAATRVFTGVGIGGILANINIVVVEYSSDRRRKLALALLTVGYPIGAALGGLVAVFLLDRYDWRAVYWFGGAVALLLWPLCWFRIPESIEYLLARRPAHALTTINGLMQRIGHPALVSLPPSATPTRGVALWAIFGSQYLSRTIGASVAYFGVMMTAYFLLSWTPRTVTALGLSSSSGISASMLMNVGGTIGCLLYGLSAGALGARRLAAFFTTGLLVMSAVFGLVPPQATALMTAAMAIGFFLYTSVTIMYSIVPECFPSTMRTTATGWAMSVGRIGAVAGPALVGVLIERGWTRPEDFAVLGLPIGAATIALYWLRPDVDDAVVAGM